MPTSQDVSAPERSQRAPEAAGLSGQGRERRAVSEKTKILVPLVEAIPGSDGSRQGRPGAGWRAARGGARVLEVLCFLNGEKRQL